MYSRVRFYDSSKVHKLKINRITREVFPKKTRCGQEIDYSNALKMKEEATEGLDKCERCYK